MASGRIAVLYINTALKGAFVSLSGTTDTISTVALTSGTQNITNGTCDMVAVSSTKLCVISETSNTATYINNLIDTSGTASAGTEISLLSSAAGAIGALSVSGNTVKFVAVRNSGTTSSSQIITVDASSTSPTISSSSPQVLYSISSQGFNGTNLSGGAINPANLVIGTDSIVPAPSHVASSLKFGSSVIGLVNTLALPSVNSTGTVVKGPTASASWFAGLADRGTWSIRKVEAGIL